MTRWDSLMAVRPEDVAEGSLGGSVGLEAGLSSWWKVDVEEKRAPSG